MSETEGPHEAPISRFSFSGSDSRFELYLSGANAVQWVDRTRGFEIAVSVSGIIKMAIFLLSPENHFMTGSDVAVSDRTDRDKTLTVTSVDPETLAIRERGGAIDVSYRLAQADISALRSVLSNAITHLEVDYRKFDSED